MAQNTIANNAVRNNAAIVWKRSASRQRLGSTFAFAGGEDACAEYCVAKARGADAVFAGDECRCEDGKRELRRREGEGLEMLLESQGLNPPIPFESNAESTIDAKFLQALTSDVVAGTDIGDTATASSLAGSSSDMSMSAAVMTTSTPTFTGPNPTAWPSPESYPISSTWATSVGSAITMGTITSSPPSASAIASDNGGDSLSRNTKIGLGVGVGVGIPALAILAAFCLFRRRRDKQRAVPKYAAQGQSELSMVEHSLPVKTAGLPRGAPPTQRQPFLDEASGGNDPRLGQVYDKPPPPPPPADVFDTPAGHSAVPSIEPEQQRGYHGRPTPLIIPRVRRSPSLLREPSPLRGDSPVSPVSSVFAMSPMNSREPSPRPPHY